MAKWIPVLLIAGASTLTPQQSDCVSSRSTIALVQAAYLCGQIDGGRQFAQSLHMEGQPEYERMLKLLKDAEKKALCEESKSLFQKTEEK